MVYGHTLYDRVVLLKPNKERMCGYPVQRLVLVRVRSGSGCLRRRTTASLGI
jgi:hypothetical protein